MEASIVSSRDNTAVIPPLNGIVADSVKKDHDANLASLNNNSVNNSGGVGLNDNTGGSSRNQQQKITNGTAGIQSQRASSNPNINARQKRAAAGVELKSMIIEFMRDKPYLWNRWHPGYNDNKRRENEFSLFSQEVNYPVSEIKRVWHVLRTNFFRAHKIQMERGPNVGSDKGDRCWKYYQSMKFILVEGAHTIINDDLSKSNVSINDDSSSSVKDIRQTRSSKVLKDARGTRRAAVQRSIQPSLINNSDSSSNNSSNVPSALTIAETATTTITAITSTSTPTASLASETRTFSSGSKSNHSRSLRAHHDDNHDTSIITNISPDQFSLAHGRASTLSAFNEVSRISFDADDDHLYARSLTATLKKFDPTTKEVIKLKFQEIIVEYMQKQQQQLQLFQQQQQQPLLAHVTSATATTTTTQPK